jgi:hypothetical protein
MKSPSFWLVTFTFALISSFFIDNIGCFSAVCVKNEGLINRQITIIYAYLAFVALYNYFYYYIPSKWRTVLCREPLLNLKKKYSLDNRHLPCIRVIDFIHIAILITNLIIVFFIWHVPRIKPNMSLRGVLGALKHSTGHIPDLLLALTILPVSRNSFFSRKLNISPSTSIRYHQLVGNMFLIGSLLHGMVIYISYEVGGKSGLVSIINWDKINNIGNWSINDWEAPTGALAFIMLVILRIFALPIVRRMVYEIFLVSHYILALPIIAILTIHSNTNLIFTFPALLLYLPDLIFRLMSYLRSPNIRVYTEPCNIIRLQVEDNNNNLNIGKKNGLFYDICFKQVSKVFSHPFSVAKWKKSSWCGKVESYVKSDYVDCKDVLTLNGPFGANVFNLDQVDVLACFVGGIGITGASQLIFEFVHEFPLKQLYLFWSIRSSEMLDLTLFKGI